MTNLEQAKYLAVKQIFERWSNNLSFEERQELYKHIIMELRKVVAYE